MNPDLKVRVARRASELGFDGCRVTGPEPPAHGERFRRWLREGRHGGMAYLERTADRRTNPELVLAGVRSMVFVAASYHIEAAGGHEPPARGSTRGIVARYARHVDYHDVLAPRLAALAACIDELGGEGTRSLWYVDTGPVLERELAERAGLGFIGKHTNLIGRTLGNWFIIGAILTTLEMEPDPPERNRCGTCRRCIDACPTGAITAPFELDARRCISYLTIELKGPIPEELRPALGRRVFGCDDCLEACPWNRFARAGRILKEQYRQDLAQPDLLELLELTPEEFKRRFAGTPILRAKRRGLLRNVCVALGNVGDARALEALERRTQDPDELIAEHARWAVDRIRLRHGAEGNREGCEVKSPCSAHPCG